MQLVLLHTVTGICGTDTRCFLLLNLAVKETICARAAAAAGILNFERVKVVYTENIWTRKISHQSNQP
jgi:hypothetical protein